MFSLCVVYNQFTVGIRRASLPVAMGLCLFANASARLARDQASGGGSGSDFSADSRYAHRNDGTVNLLTGTAAYQMNLMNIAAKSGLSLAIDLHCSGAIEGQVLRDNNIAPTGPVGLGWDLGFGTIYVDYGGAVNLANHEYFYRDADGSISEIVRQGTSVSNYTYQIKNQPHWRVEGEHDLVGESSWSYRDRITDWIITKPDGTSFHYGVTDNADPDNARRYLPRDETGFSQVGNGKFYYQWDLGRIEDANGGGIELTYEQIKTWSGRIYYQEHCEATGGHDSWPWWGGPDECPSCESQGYPGWRVKEEWDHYAVLFNGLYKCYCCYTPPSGPDIYFVSQSYPVAIASDRGDQILLKWADKGANEVGNKAYTYARRYLYQLKWLNGDDDLINLISFSYSGEAEQVPHLNAGTKREKRLLTRIRTELGTGAINRVFEYSTSANNLGLLKRIIEPMTGKSTTFQYLLRDVHSGSATYGVNVVQRIIQSGGVPGIPDVEVTYSYPTDPAKQEYDIESGVAYWAEVTATSATGSIVTTFELDDETHKFGTRKRVDRYSTTSKLVSSEVYSYSLESHGPSGSEWYFPVLTKTITTTDGVSSTSGTSLCAIDANSGIASQSWAKNSDGKTLVTKRRYAYEDHTADMGPSGTNQLTQVAGTKLIQFSSYDPTANPGACQLSGGTVVKASYTVWSGDATTPWRPSATYAWNVPMNANGLPTVGFVAFSESNPTANGWQLTSTIDKYDDYGNVLQVSDALGVAATTIYGESFYAPIATVAAAGFDDWAVFTCAYDLGETVGGDEYFDAFNGWQKGDKHSGESALEVDSTQKHFGQKSLYVKNSCGPMRKVYVPSNTDYSFSAWVYPTVGNPIEFSAAVHIDESVLPTHDYSVVKSGLALNKWQLVEITVPLADLTDIQLDANGERNDYMQIWIGNTPAMDAAEFYVDDIRIFPTKAQVTTTYYDTKWRKPIVSVDANGDPSDFTEYDTYGRPLKAYRLDKTKSNDAEGGKTIRMEKKYHLMGEELRVVSPNGGEVLVPWENVTITWSGQSTAGENGVEVRFYNGTNWSTVAGSPVTGVPVLLWNVPAGNGTACKIEVRAVDDHTNADQSDGSFTISDYLVITSPSSGDKWWSGDRWVSDHTVEWSSSGGSVTNVKIEYYDGSVWQTIVASTANDGVYHWNLLGLASAGLARLRISEAGTAEWANVSSPFYLYKNHGFVRRFSGSSF